MTLFDAYQTGFSYDDFLAKYGTEVHRQRWADFAATVKLTGGQVQLLESFKRQMPVLCMAGAWCGDCVQQCPILHAFSLVTPSIKLKFIDRDAHPEVSAQLQVCGAARVPAVVFFAEDGAEIGRHGDRTLSKYRQMARDQLGAACPTGIGPVPDELLRGVTQDWLNEFERLQLLLRLSARLRQIHAD